MQVSVTMIAHYAVRVVMLHYCDSLKQMRALWLSRIAVSIYWWSDLKAAVLIPLKGVLGSGTSFRSRSWSTEVPIRNIKTLFFPVIFVVASLVAFIGGCLMLKELINLPTVLSLCCCIINFVPPFLLILLWIFGSGRLLSRFCTIFMVASWGAGIAAMVFLWLLFPRDVNFLKAANMSLSFLDAQRSGVAGASYPLKWRTTTGLQNVYNIIFYNDSTNSGKTPIPSKEFTFARVDLSGGFYNDGQVGPVKLTWNIALTTTMLAWSMLEYKDFWSKEETVKNHAINLLAHGLTYVQSCYQITQGKDPLTGQTQNSANDIIVYVVCPCKQKLSHTLCAGWQECVSIAALCFGFPLF
jgi:hypothetical protein